MNNYKTKYYEVISSKKITRDLIKKCTYAFNKNKIFFGKGCKFFEIHIAHTEKEFKKGAGELYKPWVKGVSWKGEKVVVRAPKLYRKTHLKHGGTSDWKILLTHEMNHIFTKQLNLYKGPYWMTEGIAMYVAGQIPGKTYKKEVKLDKEKIKKLFFYRFMYKKLCEEMYTVDYYGIKYMLDKFGKSKFLRLVDSYSKDMRKADFEKSFKKIFGISYRLFLREVERKILRIYYK